MVKLLLQRKKRGTHGLVISPPLLTSTSTLLLADQDEARRREARRPAPTPEPAPAPAGRPVTPAPRPTMASSKTPTASAQVGLVGGAHAHSQWTPGLFTSEPLEIDDHHNGHNNTRPGPSLNLHYDPPKTPRTPARHVSRTPQTPTRKRSSSSFTSTSGYSPQCFKYKAGEGGVEVALGGLRSSLKGGHYTSDAAVIARTRALAAITGTPPPPLPALPPRSGTANTTTTTTNGRLRQPSAQMVSRWSLSTADDSSSDGDDGDDDDAGETAALFYAGAGRRAGASAGDNTSADTDAHPGSFAASVKSLSLSIKSSKSTAARSMRSFKSVARSVRSIKSLRMPMPLGSRSSPPSESDVVQVPVAARGPLCGATNSRREQKQPSIPPLPLRPAGAPRTDHEATDTGGPAAVAPPPPTPSRSMGKGVVDLLRRLTPHKKNRRAWFIPAETNNAPMPDLTPGREVISASPDFDETESFRSWSSDPLDPACRTPAPPVHADTNKTRYSDSGERSFSKWLGAGPADSKDRSTSTGATGAASGACPVVKKNCHLSTSSPRSVYSIAHLSNSSTMPRPISTFSLRRHSSFSGEGYEAKMTMPAPIRIGLGDHENMDAYHHTASPTSFASPRRSFSSAFGGSGSRPSSILGLSSSLGAAPLGHDASLPPTPMTPFHGAMASRETGTAPLDRGATSNAPSRPNTPSASSFYMLTKHPHVPPHPSLIAPTDMHGHEGCVPHPNHHGHHQPLPKRGRDQSHRHSALPTADMLWPSHSKPAGSTPPMSPAQRSLSPASESSHSRDRSPSGFSLLHRVPTNKTLRKVKSRASKLSFSAPFLHSHANEHHVPEVPPLPQVLSRPATPVSTTPRSVPSSASVVMVPYPFAPQARPAPVRSNASFRGTLSDDDEPLTMDGVLSIVEWGASVSRPSSIGGDTSPGRDSFSLVDIITKEDASDARSFSVQQDTASNKASTLSSSPSAPSKSSIADNNSSVGSFESFEEDDDKEPLPTAVPTFHHPSDPPRSLQDVTMVPPRATETSNPTPTLSDVLRDRTRRLSTPAGWRARSPDTSFGGTPDTPPPPMPPHKAHHTESRKSRLFSLLNRAKTSLDPSAVIDSSLPRMARMQSPAGSERERGEYCRSPTPQNNADDLGIGVPIDPFQSCSSTPTARVSDPVSPEASPYMSLALLPPHLARTTKSYTSLPRCDSDATLDCAPACENKIEPAKGGVYNYARNGSVHTFGQPSLRSLPSVESLTLVDSRSEASDECIEDEERLSGELALEALLESQEVRGARVVAAA